MELDRKIIFYDGECGFCNLSVQFVLNHERTDDIYFSSLQSDYASVFFKSLELPDPDLSTFYFYNNGVLFEKSTAALKVLPNLKWYLQIAVIGWVVPRILRDKLYDFVAKRRKKLAKGFCVLPTAEQQQRFLK